MATDPAAWAPTGGLDGQARVAGGGDGGGEDGEGPAGAHHPHPAGHPHSQRHLQHQHLQVSWTQKSSSVAEPEPVEPKLFGNLEPKPKPEPKLNF